MCISFSFVLAYIRNVKSVTMDESVANTLTLCSQLEDIYDLICNSYRLEFCDLSAVYLTLFDLLQHLKSEYVSYYNEPSFGFRIDEREPFNAISNAIANLLSVHLTQRKKFRLIIFILHVFVKELTSVLCIELCIYQAGDNELF